MDDTNTTKAYKVLKDWGDHKAGDTFTAAELAEADAIAGLIADGTIEAVVLETQDETPAPETPAAATDAPSDPAPATDVPAEPTVPPAEPVVAGADTPEAVPAPQTDQPTPTPDLAQQQTDRVTPVALAILTDMTTKLIPEDGVSFDMGELEKATIQHMLDGDLNTTTEVPLAFQGVLAALSGLTVTLDGCTFDERHTQADYAAAMRQILAIIANAQPNVTDSKSAADSIAAKQGELNTLFADQKFSAIEVRYMVSSIISAFETMRTGVEKSLEESMERAEAKVFGVENVQDVTMKKLDTFLQA